MQIIKAMQRNSVALYTVLTNNYDALQPVKPQQGVSTFVFTDNEDYEAPAGWEHVVIIPNGDVKQQRKVKIKGHAVLMGFDVWAYIDANMELLRPLNGLNLRSDILITKHPKRHCTYDEAAEVIRAKKDAEDIVYPQMEKYRQQGFPVRAGMFATGFMIRRNNERTRAFAEIWWQEVEQHSHRDQLSVVYALKNSPATLQLINHYTLRMGVKIHQHKNFNIYYSTPYSTVKDIGGANNDFIQHLPEDAWVCITDGDAMFLDPDWGRTVNDIVRLHGSAFGLIGCTTNRLGANKQLYNQRWSEDMNMRNHYEIAKQLTKEHGATVDVIDSVAGVFMLFPRTVWAQVGGFKRHRFDADTCFSRDIAKAGYKIGIARGVYMMHAYRVWETEQRIAQQNTKHLLL